MIPFKVCSSTLRAHTCNRFGHAHTGLLHSCAVTTVHLFITGWSSHIQGWSRSRLLLLMIHSDIISIYVAKCGFSSLLTAPQTGDREIWLVWWFLSWMFSSREGTPKASIWQPDWWQDSCSLLLPRKNPLQQTGNWSNLQIETEIKAEDL